MLSAAQSVCIGFPISVLNHSAFRPIRIVRRSWRASGITIRNMDSGNTGFQCFSGLLFLNQYKSKKGNVLFDNITYHFFRFKITKSSFFQIQNIKQPKMCGRFRILHFGIGRMFKESPKPKEKQCRISARPRPMSHRDCTYVSHNPPSSINALSFESMVGNSYINLVIFLK